MEYKFLSRPVGPDHKRQVVGLYREAGWWSQGDEAGPELAGRLIAGSHCFVCCVSGSEIIAMGRAISDGASDAYIQDVYVKTACRKQGMAREITRLIIERLLQDGMKWIGLIATPEALDLYAKMGFVQVDRTAMVLKMGDEEVQC